MNKTKWYTEKVLFLCKRNTYPAQAVRWDKCNLTRFSTNLRFEDFSECFRGPL